MPKVLRIAKGRKIEDVEHVDNQLRELDDLDVTVALIQTLVPLGLRAAEEALLREVTMLAGRRYGRNDGMAHRIRWGRQRGSIYVGDQNPSRSLGSGTVRPGRKSHSRHTRACNTPGPQTRGSCGGSCTG